MNYERIKMRKPVVGEELFLVEKKSKEKVIGYVKVASVGRKYFTLAYPMYVPHNKFSIDSWKQVTEYSREYYLCENEKIYLDKLEARKYSMALQKKVKYDWNEYSLDQLKKVAEILGVNLDDN